MAELERKSESFFKNPKSPNSATFEQLLQGDEGSLSSNTSPNSKCYDLEEAIPHQQNNKKSVLTKVKERAKKLRHSLSGGRRKHDNQSHGESSTPAWGVTLEDEDDNDEDEDPEYLGAPMYESELAPEAYKETARQHPRADPMFSEKNVSPQSIKHGNENENKNGKERSHSSNMTATETVSKKLAPASAAISDATQSIDFKISGLSITKSGEQPKTQKTGGITDHGAMEFGQNAEGIIDEKQQGGSSPIKWDKGVSVKEYFMNKLEPGEDERALSKVISEAISPRRAPGEKGVVEKVREVVTSFLQPQEPSSNSISSSSSSSSSSTNLGPTKATNLSQQTAISTTNTNPSLSKVATSTTNTTSSPQASISNNGNSSPIIPISTDAHEVFKEQTHGRILQTN